MRARISGSNRLIVAATTTVTTLAYFLGGLCSSFMFWAGLLFGYPLYPVRIAFVSASLSLVGGAWVLHRGSGRKRG